MVTTNAVTSPDPGSPAPGPGMSNGRRWLAFGFFASLVVNLFLVGLILGRILHPGFLFGGGAYVQEFGPMAGRVIQHLVAHLADSDRQTVLDQLKSHADSIAALNQSLREQRQTLMRLLKADNFDRKAVDDALVELRRRNDALQEAMETAIADAVEKLPASARKQLAP
jgi:uncharacterized membrane protein